MKKEDVEMFAHKLSLLGGRISYHDESKISYIDIEEFFLDATRFVFADSRLSNCIEHWIREYGFIISPAKVKKLIKKGYQYDPAVLGVFLELISKTNKKQIQLGSVKTFVRKKRKHTNRNSKNIEIKKKWRDPLWEKYGIIATKFYNENTKNLRSGVYILRECPEIKHRIEGKGIIESDILSYVEKGGNIRTIQSLVKIIHAEYSNIHKVITRFYHFEIIPTIQN